MPYLKRDAAFRRHFRECDALLFDDLNFLATKKATQEEFLHKLDALVADDRQVVLTCDVHPKLADEFKTMYGNLTNGQFVTLVYQNVLDRNPKPADHAYWKGQLDQGVINRGRLMTLFSESAE